MGNPLGRAIPRYDTGYPPAGREDRCPILVEPGPALSERQCRGCNFIVVSSFVRQFYEFTAPRLATFKELSCRSVRPHRSPSQEYPFYCTFAFPAAASSLLLAGSALPIQLRRRSLPRSENRRLVTKDTLEMGSR